MRKKLMNGIIMVVLAVSLVLSMAVGAAEEERTDAQPSSTAELSTIEHMMRLRAAVDDLWRRDRSQDTPLYRIDDEFFVSQEDVAVLLTVLTFRTEYQRAVGFDAVGELVPVTEEAVRDYLVRELLLNAKARELGYGDMELRRDCDNYKREGWRLPEPPAPDPSDTQTLISQGLMRMLLWKEGLNSPQSSMLPYEGNVPMIDAVIDSLYALFPSTVSYDIPVASARGATYKNVVAGLAFDPPVGWARADLGFGNTVFASPDGSGIILVTNTDTRVTPEMADAFSVDTAVGYMQLSLNSGGVQDDIDITLFKKTIGENERFYAITTFSCTVEDISSFCAMYFFSSSRGDLFAVYALSAGSWDGEGADMMEWFTQMTKQHMPADACQALWGQGIQ